MSVFIGFILFFETLLNILAAGTSGIFPFFSSLFVTFVPAFFILFSHTLARRFLALPRPTLFLLAFTALTLGLLRRLIWCAGPFPGFGLAVLLTLFLLILDVCLVQFQVGRLNDAAHDLKTILWLYGRRGDQVQNIDMVFAEVAQTRKRRAGFRRKIHCLSRHHGFADEAVSELDM